MSSSSQVFQSLSEVLPEWPWYRILLSRTQTLIYICADLSSFETAQRSISFLSNLLKNCLKILLLTLIYRKTVNFKVGEETWLRFLDTLQALIHICSMSKNKAAAKRNGPQIFSSGSLSHIFKLKILLQRSISSSPLFSFFFIT